MEQARCECGHVFELDEGQIWCSRDCWVNFCNEAGIDPTSPFKGFVSAHSPEGQKILLAKDF
jgi:hypothetical protein